MRPVFHVLTEGWIPVITLEGKREMLGIRAVLARAHQLKELSDASPMVEYSLYRFLSVFLMDALRPEDTETLEELLEDGGFDMEKIDAYIEECLREGTSFDLFDEKRPFCQSPYREEWDKTLKPISTLDYTMPSGNNHVHFDHRTVTKLSLPFDEAARQLFSSLLFCTAGAQGYPSGVNGKPPYYTIISGETLFHTLVYTLVPLERITIPFDEPPVAWRNFQPIEPKKEVGKTSWLQGMLFPTRRVLLVPDEEKEEVSQVYFSQGMNFVNMESWNDPFVTYRVLDSGRAPWRPDREKPVWRNLYDLINVSNRQAPYILEQYAELAEGTEYGDILLYGVQTNNASYLDVARHSLRIPLKLTRDEEVVEVIKACIAASEQVARGLKSSLTNAEVVPETQASQAVQIYYESCERALWSLCSEKLLAPDRPRACYLPWCMDLAIYAREAREQVLQQMNLRGRALARVMQEEKTLWRELRKIQEVAEA